MMVPRARDHRALDGVQADAAAADHQHRRARLDLGMARHGADAGRHAAADQRRLRPRHVLADRHDHLLRHDDLLGEGADARHLVDALALVLDAQGAVVQRARRHRGAADAQHRAALACSSGSGRNAGRKEKITWSPGFTVVTPGPTSAISPAASWPGTIGIGEGQSPFMMCQSLWQTPEARILTRTSLALGGSSSHSTTCSGSLGLNRTAAFMAFLPASAGEFLHTLSAVITLGARAPPDVARHVARRAVEQRRHRGLRPFCIAPADRLEHRPMQRHRWRRRAGMARGDAHERAERRLGECRERDHEVVAGRDQDRLVEAAVRIGEQRRVVRRALHLGERRPRSAARVFLVWLRAAIAAAAGSTTARTCNRSDTNFGSSCRPAAATTERRRPACSTPRAAARACRSACARRSGPWPTALQRFPHHRARSTIAAAELDLARHHRVGAIAAGDDRRADRCGDALARRRMRPLFAGR